MVKSSSPSALARKLVIGVVLLAPVVIGLLTFAAEGGGQTSTRTLTGPYAGVAGSYASAIATPAPTATPEPEIPPAPPAPAPVATAQLTPTPSPAVLAATTAPQAIAATPPVAHPQREPAVSCPRYAILLDPSPGLRDATEAAMVMWGNYLGCPAFQIGSGGIQVRYESGWPGACLDRDIAACTMNAILLSPVPPLYHPAGVIAHELGHVLNLEHGEGPAIMDPGQWYGPSTTWCSLQSVCQ